jgi:TonB family protein
LYIRADIMAQLGEGGSFCLLPSRRPPWGKFVLTLAAESLALFVSVWMGVLHHVALTPPVHDYHFIRLVATPVPVNHVPAPVRDFAASSAPKIVVRLPQAQKVTAEKRSTSPAQETTAPKLEVTASKPLTLPPAVPVVPRLLVKTNVFSTGSSAPPTMARAPQQVQTGGFGDPNGVPAHENKGKPITIASLGSYDMPVGSGYGNGTRGERGARGVVASAGFGDGVAVGDGSGRVNASRGTVRESGFASADSMATAKVPSKPGEAGAASRLLPAEIVFKPAPAYTAEARKLRIEGEVLLEVVFESTGKLRILRVVQGLGHGLDDSAVRAAEQIRFKPALRDGQPTDCKAVVHIVFQLA